ncbi:hypothetical protein [Schleiferia thermophila]|uniref:hypothetical protein n=1 Tax=Schleiferia thermophila TaxID=884107 RepID=UPI001363CD78|nr:hypothetical protein [Schleiferia thermophila]
MTALFFGFSCGNKSISCFNDKCLYLPASNVFYNAVFIEGNKDSTFYEIQMITTKSNFLFQNKLKYIVERIPNLTYPEKFLSESTTGFIETQERIWLHPPRTAQFKFITQLAPYPEVLLPINIGDSISGKINMLGNWGDWSGKSSEFYLNVVKDSTLTINERTDTVYILNGCGKILTEISCVNYLFSFTYGFIYAYYTNNNGQRFIMKRKDIIFDI